MTAAAGAEHITHVERVAVGRDGGAAFYWWCEADDCGSQRHYRTEAEAESAGREHEAAEA